MKNYIRISKYLQIALLLTFFLPFFPAGCDFGPSADQIAKQKEADSIKVADSLKRVQFSVDSIRIANPGVNFDSVYDAWNKIHHPADNSLITQSIHKDSTLNVNSITKDSVTSIQKTVPDSLPSKKDSINNSNLVDSKSVIERLSKKSKILEYLLLPSGNYSGIGYLIDNMISYVYYGGSITSFIFLLIGLIFKHNNFNCIFHFSNILAWIFLFLAHASFLKETDLLWGYWVCLGFGFAMIVYDTAILAIIRKHKIREIKNS